ncbi:MAG: hypothetical protein AAGC93_24605, partial [Cyanobacteria bacterium P01_F01_bin.53]
MKPSNWNKVLVRQLLSFGGIMAILFTAMAIGSRPGESLPVPSPTGLVIKQSPHSVEETHARFMAILEEKGLNI